MSESLIEGYEARIEELDQEKLRLGGSIKKLKTTVDFETALDTVMHSSPTLPHAGRVAF